MNELGDASRTVVSRNMCASELSSYCDKKVEDMNAKASEAVGETRTKLYQEIMAYLYEEEATVPVAHLTFRHGLSQRLVWQARLDGFILAKEMSIRQ